VASNTQVWLLICLGLGLGRLECKDKQRLARIWGLVALLPLAWCVILRVRLKAERDRDRERGVREGRNGGREEDSEARTASARKKQSPRARALEKRGERSRA
jgi:hypothetical protein